MQCKIELVTLTDCQKFSTICAQLGGKIELYNPKNNYRGNAKSLLGCLSAVEWSDLWVSSDEDISEYIINWISNDDSASIHE